MAAFRKFSQFFEREAVAEMQVGRSWIHPELDPERPVEGKLARQLRWRNNFSGAAGKRRRLFIRLIVVHVPLRQVCAPELDWSSSVQEFRRCGIARLQRPGLGAADLSAFGGALAMKMRMFARGDYLTGYAYRPHLAARDHPEYAQPALHNTERALVDHANF